MTPDFASPRLKVGRGDLRRRNRWLLLHLIQTHGPSSQAGLARRSGLSPATVSAILQPLIENRTLVEEGKAQSGIGRKASILAFNPRSILIAGVSIEQEECEVALVDLSARVLDHVTAEYPRYTEPREVADLAVARIRAMLRSNRIDSRALAGIGVAIPGLVDSDSGLVCVATNLGWRNVQLRALFEQKTQLPASVEHLGRAKARAQAVWGQGAGHRNFVCLEIGSGIGAGVVADGRILIGAGAFAGEVGHTVLDPSGPRCACGLDGCWETFCASPAIRRRIGEHLASDAGTGSTLTPGSSVAELGRAAGQGDPVARRVVAETARHLARGLVNVIWNFDPEVVILSGSVVRNCPSLIEATQAGLAKLEAARSFNVPLVAASHESDASVIAASAVVSFRRVEELANG